MLALTIQPESTQQKNNGKRFQKRANQRIILFFSTLHIYPLHLEILTKMHGLFGILSNRDIQLRSHNHSLKISDFMERGLAPSLSFVTPQRKQKESNRSSRSLLRAMFSNPPIHGARIVAEILGDEELTNIWREKSRAWPNASSP